MQRAEEQAMRRAPQPAPQIEVVHKDGGGIRTLVHPLAAPVLQLYAFPLSRAGSNQAFSFSSLSKESKIAPSVVLQEKKKNEHHRGLENTSSQISGSVPRLALGCIVVDIDG